MVEHMECMQAFWETCVQEHFFLSVQDPLVPGHCSATVSGAYTVRMLPHRADA